MRALTILLGILVVVGLPMVAYEKGRMDGYEEGYPAGHKDGQAEILTSYEEVRKVAVESLDALFHCEHPEITIEDELR